MQNIFEFLLKSVIGQMHFVNVGNSIFSGRESSVDKLSASQSGDLASNPSGG